MKLLTSALTPVIPPKPECGQICLKFMIVIVNAMKFADDQISFKIVTVMLYPMKFVGGQISFNIVTVMLNQFLLQICDCHI